jgi:acetyl esterase
MLLWFHGGGWVIGDLDSADPTARHLAVGASCVVVSVDYRLAPETKFPGPADDCYAATQWAIQHAASLNANPERVAVGGDSAGGNLAAAVALMGRDRKSLSLAFQLLVYPVTHCNYSTNSYQNYAEGHGLTRDGMQWFWEHYLQTSADANNPYAAPLVATDLSNVPPALVITAECDPLCDEGAAYAQRLSAAGIPTTYTCYPGMIHGFFAMPALLDKGKQAVAEASAALRQAFAAQPVAAR